MYTKTETFDFMQGKFMQDKVSVRLVVEFNVDEKQVLSDFKDTCSELNASNPKRKNNCEISIGEITHLASIFLYESVQVLLDDFPEIIPPESAFEYEETGIFVIVLKVDSSVFNWKYVCSPTFCRPVIIAVAKDIIKNTALSLTKNCVTETLNYISPVIVWPLFVHEFTHQLDHLALFRALAVETRYSKKVGTSGCTKCEEINPTLLFFVLLAQIRGEGIANFCQRYVSNKLININIRESESARSIMWHFAEKLNKADYRALTELRYLLGYHMCFIIAIYLITQSKSKIYVLKSKEDIIGSFIKRIVKINDLVKDILSYKEFTVWIEKKDFELVKQTLIATKNFSGFLTLYETACNFLGIPVEMRLLDWEFYRTLKKIIREKTIAGEKIRSTYLERMKESLKKLFK